MKGFLLPSLVFVFFLATTVTRCDSRNWETLPVKKSYKRSRHELEKFYFPNNTLTHKIIGSYWDPPISGIEDFYNTTYPLIPVLNVTKIENIQELEYLVGPKLVASINQAFDKISDPQNSLSSKNENLPLIWQHFYWPLVNTTSEIRIEAMFEYVNRKYKLLKKTNPDLKINSYHDLSDIYKNSSLPNERFQFDIDFPSKDVDYIAKITECEIHHYQFIVERTIDGHMKRESFNKPTRPISDEVTQQKICKKHSKCFKNRYRPFNGKCTNMKHPMSGVSMQPLKRILEAEYEDGLSRPKESGLPNVREVSKLLRQHENDELDDNQHTIFLMQWGQFLDHDLSLTVPSPNPNVRNTEPLLHCTAFRNGQLFREG